MFLDDDLLDSPSRDINQKMPPAVATFEKYMFPIIYIIQYICLLQITTAPGYNAIFGILIGGSLLFFTGVWQLIGGLLAILTNPEDKQRRLYFIAAISDLALLFLCLFVGVYELAFVLAFVTSHLLAWFYWYLSKKDSDLRQSILQNR
jgi:hypothetical protein